MYDRMIQAETDHRRERLTRGTPVKRRSGTRTRFPFFGDSGRSSRRAR